MAKKRAASGKKVPRRKPRADAQRNRERILEAAKAAFTQHGANASLDEIAKQAGVGPGTLYRHFPARESLIEAVYYSEVKKLVEAGRRFTETMGPVEALRAWLLLVVDLIAAKRIIASSLKGVIENPSRLYESSKIMFRAANDALMKRAIDSGDLRSDIDPSDLFQALIGASHLSSGPGWQQSAIRLVDILITGSLATRKNGSHR